MDPWNDSENYPQDRLSQDAIHGDPIFYRRRLAKACENLCLQTEYPEDVAALRDHPVVITDVPKGGSSAQRQTEPVFANAENNELTRCLRDFHDPARQSRTIIIQPSDPDAWSWCHIGITVEMLRQILTTYQVMPGFLDYVHMFGWKVENSDNSFGGGIHELHFADKSGLLDQYETSYSLNYVVEKNEENDPWKRWSIRRTAVYQKFSYDDQSSTWILLFPSERVRERVQESLQAQSERTSINRAQKTLETHMVLFSSATENWRSFYNFLEEYFEKRTRGALDTSDKTESKTFDVKFDDLRIWQRFEELVHEFQRSLDANKEAILALVKLNNDIRDFSPASEKDDQCWYRVDHALEKCRLEIDLRQRNIESFLKRISGRSQLVLSNLVIRFSNERADTQLSKLYNILDLKNSTIVSFHEQVRSRFDGITRRETERAQKVAEDMRHLNLEMRDMAKQTSKDAVSMKIITLVAMIYLPITFIATFLNSGITTFQHDDFIEVKSDALALKAKMSYSREAFAMFMIMSVPLLAITLLVWFLLERRIRKQLKEKAERTRRLEEMDKKTVDKETVDKEAGKEMIKEISGEDIV